MKLEKIILTEFEKLQIPNLKVEIKSHSEFYSISYKTEDFYYIQVSISSNLKNSMMNNSNSYLNFWYNKKDKIIEDINFKLEENLKGKGYGRKLTETMEEVGKKLKCKIVRIYVNINPSFWNHLGYKQIDNLWEKQI